MTSSLLFQLLPLPPRLGRGEGGGGPRRRGRDREERRGEGGVLAGPGGREERPRGSRKTVGGSSSRDFGERWVDLTDNGVEGWLGGTGGREEGRGADPGVQPPWWSQEKGARAGVAAARAREAQASLYSVLICGYLDKGWVCSRGRRGMGDWV